MSGWQKNFAASFLSRIKPSHDLKKRKRVQAEFRGFLEKLEVRRVLTGDATGNVPDSFDQYVPSGLGGGDFVAYEDLYGGEELVRIPESVTGSIPDNDYTWELEAGGLLGFGIKDAETITGTSYGYSSTESADDDYYYVTLSKYDYTIEIGDWYSPSGEYSEDLNVNRSSWVIKLSDPSLAESFVDSSGDLQGLGDVLSTSDASWDYEFDSGFASSGDPKATVLIDYDIDVTYDWQEELSAERLDEIGFLPDTAGEINNVLRNSGTLSIEGSSNATADGTLTVTAFNEGANDGYDFDVSGQRSSFSDGVTTTLEASGALAIGSLNLSGEEVVDASGEGKLFKYAIDSTVVSNNDNKTEFDGNGHVTQTSTPDRTGEISIDLVKGESGYTKDASLEVDTDSVKRDVIKINLAGEDSIDESYTYTRAPSDADPADSLDSVRIKNDISTSNHSKGTATSQPTNDVLNRVIHDIESATDTIKSNAATTLDEYESTAGGGGSLTESNQATPTSSETYTKSGNSSSTTTGTANSSSTNNGTYSVELPSKKSDKLFGNSTVNTERDFTTVTTGDKTETTSVDTSSDESFVGVLPPQIKLENTVDDSLVTNTNITVNVEGNSSSTVTEAEDGVITIVTNGTSKTTQTFNEGNSSVGTRDVYENNEGVGYYQTETTHKDTAMKLGLEPQQLKSGTSNQQDV